MNDLLWANQTLCVDQVCTHAFVLVRRSIYNSVATQTICMSSNGGLNARIIVS